MATTAHRIGIAVAVASVTGIALATACGLSDEGSGPQVPFKPETGAADNYIPPPPNNDDGSVPADAGIVDATIEAAVDSGSCPQTGRGPAMVRMFGQCIDVTEVTNEQYEAFLSNVSDASFPDGSLPSMCSYKSGPPTKEFGRIVDATTLGAADPEAFVDYCDALAFCAWSGKRICRDDAGAGTWLDVCSSQGSNAYSYGNTAQSGICNDNLGAVTEAGSLPGCRVGDAGPFDMNGNVMEWVGPTCYDAGAKFNCDLRGGWFGLDAAVNACGRGELQPIDTRQSYIGFRCCAD